MSANKILVGKRLTEPIRLTFFYAFPNSRFQQLIAQLVGDRQYDWGTSIRKSRFAVFVATFIVYGIDDETGDLEVLPATRRSAARTTLNSSTRSVMRREQIRVRRPRHSDRAWRCR